MNSSTILKRTLPILIVILVIVGIAVGVSVLNTDKAVPGITEKDGLYFEVEEGGRKFSITNDEVYQTLKSSVGLTILLEQIDRELLKSVPLGNSNYYDSVSEEDIDEEIKKATYPTSTYPNGSDDLDGDEIADAVEAFEDAMYLNNGLRTEAARRDHFRLVLARKSYARYVLEEEIKETDAKAKEDDDLDKFFTEKEIENYYKANYLNGYWAMVVPFTSKIEAETILKQLGIKIHVRDTSVSGDYTRWVWEEKVEGEDGELIEVDLTSDEVVQAFIDMYNSVNSYTLGEDYPSKTEVLTEGVEYFYNSDPDAEEGKSKYSFNSTLHEDEENLANRFYWTNQEIKNYQSEIQNFLKVSLNSYASDDTIKSGKTWFTPELRSYNSNKLFVYILKIDEEEALKQEDVLDEIHDALFDAEITDSYINKAMAKLRNEKDLVIYDEYIETNYLASIASFELDIDKTKEESETLIAKVAGKEYSADDLFKLMDTRYGLTIVTAEINYLRLLYSEKYNDIYKYHLSDETEANRIMDRDTWKEIRDRAVNEKRNFAANAYASQGFPSSYGWENFLNDYYGIESSEELPFYFLYSEILAEFTRNLGSIEDLEEDSEEWLDFLGKMTEPLEEYFSVTGVHLLISVRDADGNPTHPDDWTEIQKNYAEELYQQVWRYYDDAPGTASEKLKTLQTKFEESPRFLASRDQTASAQPDGFDYIFGEDDIYSFEFSKAKSAGLTVEFQDLNNFTNGQMVEEFNDVVKEIWDSNPNSSEEIAWKNINEEDETYTPIITKFGYHAYINLSSNDITRWDEDETGFNGVVPTLQMVKTYFNDNAALYLIDEDGNDTEVEFTTAMKTAVTTYFSPIHTELTGNYYSTTKLYEELTGLDISFNSGNYTKDTFKDFVDLRIKSYLSGLKYFNVEE